jgi:glutathione synthase/RimK-type ligase-like ATP-grasp enzyme
MADFLEIRKKVDVIDYTELYYDNWYKNILTKKPIKKYDTIWLTSSPKVSDRANWLLYFFNEKQKKIVNFTWCRKNSKLIQNIFFDIYSFDHPKTIAFFIKKPFIETYIHIIKKSFIFPIVLKKNKSSKWEWITLIQNQSTLKKYFLQHNEEVIIIQEKIINNGDYRIFVVKNTTPLWFKRYNPNDFRSNLSLGWSYTLFTIPQAIKKICIDVNKKFGLDFCWIDLFIDDKNIQIIEINTLPWYKLKIKDEIWFNLLYELFNKHNFFL